MMKRIILMLIGYLFIAPAMAATYVYHEGRETVAHILAVNFESSLELPVSVLSEAASPSIGSEDVVISVGLSSFKTLCELPGEPNIVALFIGEEEFYSAAAPCIDRASAVFSGAPVELRLQILNSFWEGRSPIALVYSDGLPVNTEAIRVAAERFGYEMRFVAVGNGRENALRAFSSVLDNTDVVMSIYDSTLFDSQLSKDVIRLMFQKRKLLAAHSLQLVKAGALFALYSSTGRKLSAVVEQIKVFHQTQHLPPPKYPDGIQVAFNSYLIRMYGLVLPTDVYLFNEFGVCSESGCQKALN